MNLNFNSLTHFFPGGVKSTLGKAMQVRHRIHAYTTHGKQIASQYRQNDVTHAVINTILTPGENTEFVQSLTKSTTIETKSV